MQYNQHFFFLKLLWVRHCQKCFKDCSLLPVHRDYSPAPYLCILTSSQTRVILVIFIYKYNWSSLDNEH